LRSDCLTASHSSSIGIPTSMAGAQLYR